MADLPALDTVAHRGEPMLAASEHDPRGDGLWLRSQRVHQLVPQAWYGRVRARARLYGRGSRDRGPAVPGQWFVGVYVSPAPLQAWPSSETWRQCGLREFAPLLAAVQMVAGMMTASKEL